MPRIHGYSKATINKNIRAEVRAGRPQKQAVAMAYQTARSAAKQAGKRPAHLR